MKVLSTIIMAILISSLFLNARPVISDPVTDVPRHVPDRLLIKFKSSAADYEKNQILNSNGAAEIAEIKQIRVKIIAVPEHALEKIESALRNNNAVEYVEKDYILEPALVPNDTYLSNQWHLTKINAQAAWDLGTGSSIIPIAILDTGVDPTHPDLAAKLQNGYNFYSNNNDWTDTCGHGTRVAGTAAAITNNGVGVAGVAWANPIIPIKITDSACYGYYSAMINGIVYAADSGAKAANISFLIYNGAALTDAARYMHDRGGWVVAAAGNTGVLENYSDNPYMISVGATTSADVVSSYSSYGPYVDFAAPGSSIYTTANGGLYGAASGTSFASPVVAGLVTLIKSKDPSLSSTQIYEILKTSSADLGAQGKDNYYGWGRVDAYSALSQINSPAPDTTPPTVTITNPQNNQIVSGSVTVSVSAVDNTSVAKVDLIIDGAFYGQKTTSPYQFTVDTTKLSSSGHTISATAYDPSNNSNSASVLVNVQNAAPDTTPPIVTIMSPANGSTLSGKVKITINASDDNKVSSVKILVDNNVVTTLLNSPYQYVWNTKSVKPGTHQLIAEAIDVSENISRHSIAIKIVR